MLRDPCLQVLSFHLGLEQKENLQKKLDNKLVEYDDGS